MKKTWLSGFLAVCVLLTYAPVAQGESLLQESQSQVAVDENRFPDEKFRSWLLDRRNINGAGADGRLTQEEIAAVSRMDVSGLGIFSLEGIEVFTQLEELNCSDNRLTELDVSQNTRLKRLYCSYNQIGSLSMESNPDLVSVSANFNRISALDASGKPALRNLSVEMNAVETLNLAGSTALEWLSVANNRLTALDVSENGQLRYVNAFDNQLEALDVSGLTELDFLNVADNRLTELDVSKNQKLSSFFVTDNHLERLTLPNREGAAVELDQYNRQAPVDGYDNVQWYLDEEGAQPVEGTMEARGQTIYARRIANRYQIRFSDGFSSGSMPAIFAVYDQEITLPAASFTRYGYTFSHWNTLPRGDGDSYSDQATVRNVAGKWDGARITLYAQWVPSEYKIAFDGGDPGATGQMESIEAVYDSSVSLPKSAFSLEEKEFAGWAAEPGGPVLYPDGATVQNLSDGGVVTLYGVWKTPAEQAQRVYLDQLEQAFRAYGPEDYTGQDWTVLAGIYDQSQEEIRSAQESGAMEDAVARAQERMAGVQSREERIREMTEGWQAAYAPALELLQAPLTESGAHRAEELAQAALEDLSFEGLCAHSSLQGAEDLQQTAARAQSSLSAQAEMLGETLEAARWLQSLDGMSTRAPEQVDSQSAAAYRSKLEEYETLEDGLRERIAPEVQTLLEERSALAERKRSAVAQLQTHYREHYGDDARQEALLQALEEGVRQIEQSGSDTAVQAALQQGREALEQAAQPTPQPTPTPPAGGSGGSSGSNGGSGGSGGSSGGSGGSSGGSGGSGAVGTYGIDLQQTGRGSVKASAAAAAKGAKVTLEAEPEEGYELALLTVTDAEGSEISLQQEEASYTFTMPGSRVTVTASFWWNNPFTDVDRDAWYYGAVEHGVTEGLFVGSQGETFLPDDSMTRAMLATVLYRAAGEEKAAGPAQRVFDDVDPESWYGPAVQWGVENGIITGTGDGRFDPQEHVTREQLAALLPPLCRRACGAGEFGELHRRPPGCSVCRGGPAMGNAERRNQRHGRWHIGTEGNRNPGTGGADDDEIHGAGCGLSPRKIPIGRGALAPLFSCASSVGGSLRATKNQFAGRFSGRWKGARRPYKKAAAFKKAAAGDSYV